MAQTYRNILKKECNVNVKFGYTKNPKAKGCASTYVLVCMCVKNMRE